jgi:histidine kinase-like protein
MIDGATRQGESVSVVLPASPGSASRARNALRPLRGLLEESRFLDLRLVVSELVAESLCTRESAKARIELRAEVSGGSIHVEVLVDDDAVFRIPSRQSGPGTPGWGLNVMSRLADRWGVRRDRATACAWFEIATRLTD